MSKSRSRSRSSTTTDEPRSKLRVDIWVDVVCPWCYVGKRRFERALAEFEHRDEVEVVHHAFELDPRTPRGRVVDQSVELARKYGMTVAEAQARQKQLETLAADEGLELRLVGGLVGNTFDAHRLLHLARERGLQEALMERLLRAHFSEQRSVFDEENLVALSVEAGLDAEEVRRVLAADAYARSVRADEAQAHAIGARGVPFFLFDGRYAVSGAQRSELFAEVLSRTWAERQGDDSAERVGHSRV